MSSESATGAPHPPSDQIGAAQLIELRRQIDEWAQELGFDAVGVTDLDLSAHADRLQGWLDAGCHGEMTWLARNTDLRLDPAKLVDGVIRAVVVRMNYLPPGQNLPLTLEDHERGYIARYALGRDYHKVLRRRLARLAERLTEAIEPLPHRYRVFTDSAPVLERALAAKAGHGWVGRHSLLLNRDAGSWFFLGELFTDLPLPLDSPADDDNCGACKACVKVCPTDAIRPDRTIDARRCISYLTIENKGTIPAELRTRVGNRIFGCDDCQVWCPWNRDAPVASEPDFTPRDKLLDQPLDQLFALTEAEFLALTEGSAMRRISHEQWQRNLAVALGNAAPTAARIELLKAMLKQVSPMVAEHIRWALDQLSLRNVER